MIIKQKNEQEVCTYNWKLILKETNNTFKQAFYISTQIKKAHNHARSKREIFESLLWIRGAQLCLLFDDAYLLIGEETIHASIKSSHP